MSGRSNSALVGGYFGVLSTYSSCLVGDAGGGSLCDNYCLAQLSTTSLGSAPKPSEEQPAGTGGGKYDLHHAQLTCSSSFYTPFGQWDSWMPGEYAPAEFWISPAFELIANQGPQYSEGTESHPADSRSTHKANNTLTTKRAESESTSTRAQRVYTLLVVDSPNQITREFQNTADEVLMWGGRQSSRQSVLLNELCAHHLSGSNAALTIANSPRCVAASQELFVTFIEQTTASVMQAGASSLPAAITVGAMPPDGSIVDLLRSPDELLSNKLEIGVSPIFGGCIVNLTPLSLKDEKHAAVVARDSLQRASLLGVDPFNCPGSMIWAMLLIKQCCKDEKDLYISLMHVALLGNNLERFTRVVREEEEGELWLLFSSVFGGSARTVFASMVDGVEGSGDLLNTGAQLRQLKLGADSDVSVRRFIRLSKMGLRSSEDAEGKCANNVSEEKSKIQKMVKEAQHLPNDPIRETAKAYFGKPNSRRSSNSSFRSLPSADLSVSGEESMEQKKKEQQQQQPKLQHMTGEIPPFLPSILVQRPFNAREPRSSSSIGKLVSSRPPSFFHHKVVGDEKRRREEPKELQASEQDSQNLDAQETQLPVRFLHVWEGKTPMQQLRDWDKPLEQRAYEEKKTGTGLEVSKKKLSRQLRLKTLFSDFEASDAT